MHMQSFRCNVIYLNTKGSVYVTLYMYNSIRKSGNLCRKKRIFLNNFKMIARFSKCDFWIPGQILDFKKFVSKKKVFFLKSKKILKKFEILKKWKISGIFRIFNGFPQYSTLAKKWNSILVPTASISGQISICSRINCNEIVKNCLI